MINHGLTVRSHTTKLCFWHSLLFQEVLAWHILCTSIKTEIWGLIPKRTCRRAHVPKPAEGINRTVGRRDSSIKTEKGNKKWDKQHKRREMRLNMVITVKYGNHSERKQTGLPYSNSTALNKSPNLAMLPVRKTLQMKLESKVWKRICQTSRLENKKN